MENVFLDIYKSLSVLEREVEADKKERFTAEYR